MPPSVDQASAQLAAQAYRDNVSPRMARLDKLERFSRGEQYEGRENFFSDRAALLDRAPCIVYDLVDQAIRSHASMVLGEGRFPQITSHADEDNDELDERFGLGREDSAVLDPFVEACSKKARLRPTARRLLESALRCGTAVAVPQVVRGHLTVESLPAKRCVPRFRDDDPEADLLSLEVRYPYVQDQRAPGSQRVEQVALLYRRVIDDRFDTIYQPVRANRGGGEPSSWPVKSRVEHGLGFCPAIWYRACAEDATRGEIDGRPLHQNLLDELYALDLSRSQVHRGVISTLDPILAELGVEPGFQPAPQVDGPRLNLTDDPLRAWQSGSSRPAWQARGRKRAPGMAYQYPVGADVKMLTLPGDAFKAGFDNVLELKTAIASSLHWVPNDPEQTTQSKNAGPMSGKAREWIYRKQTEFDDELRCDFGDRCLLRLVDLILRVLFAASKRGDVRVPGIARVVPILERFEAEEETGKPNDLVAVWVPPELDLVWPPYFESSDDDQKLVADTVRADLAAKVITVETAVKKIAPWYGISDPAGYARDLAAKAQEDAAALHEANALLAGGGESGPNAPPEPANPTANPPSGGSTAPGPSMPPSSDGSTSIRQADAGGSAAKPGPAAEVKAQLAPDFPPSALAWIDTAKWEGPVKVPLAQIDFSNAATWSATDNGPKVAKFARKIGDGKMKPLVLVRRPGSDRLMVADGHHRALAYRQLGQDPPAYVATVATAAGPWDTMHAAQKQSPGRESSGPQGETPAPGMPGRGPSSPAGASSGANATPTRRKPRAPAYAAAGGLLG